jgi:hypothetical protein
MPEIFSSGTVSPHTSYGERHFGQGGALYQLQIDSQLSVTWYEKSSG